MTIEHRYDNRWFAYTLGWVAVAGVLLIVRQSLGYPAFHLFVELFAVVVAALAFTVTWNARRYFTNGYLLVLGIAYLFVAGIDLLHAVTYRGVGIIPDVSTDLPTQLWLAARYLQAVAVLAAPLFVTRRARPATVFWVFAAASVLLVGSIIAGIFPRAFIEDSGLTPFKIWSEWVVVAAFLVGLSLFARARRHFDPGVSRFIALSIATSALAEVMFTLYAHPFGPWNLAGHFVRIIAYFALYRAVVYIGLTRPYDVLFRELTQTADALRDSEVRYRSTFEQASLGIAHVGLDGSWLTVNPRFANITGYPVDELLELSPDAITHPEDLVRQRKLDDALVGELIADYDLEERYIRKDKSVIWVNTTRTLLTTEEGAPKYFIATVEDIDRRKRAEYRLRASRDLNAALAAIDQTILASLDIDEVLWRVVEETGAALDADSASIMLREGDLWVPVHAWQFPEDIIGSTFTDADVPIPIRDEDDSEPLALDDAPGDPRANSATMHLFGISSAMAVPMRFREERIGILYVNFHGEPHAFTEDEIDFARKLSVMLTLFIENARLYESQHRIADTLQAALLTAAPEIPGVDLAMAYRSVAELTRIGGDFYDVFEAHPGRVAFVVGDVAGKGLEAATLTAMARSTIRAFAYREDRPAQVLTSANRAITQQIDEARFITAIYGVLDLGTGVMSVACAGHPAPVVCTIAGCAEDITVRNLPLGVDPDSIFEEYESRLEIGDRFVMYTDGLIDSRRGSEFLGESGVRDVLDSLGDASPQVVVERLLATAEEHAGGHPSDDIAVVAFRYLGPDSVGTVDSDPSSAGS
ncbi:MAG: MASE3 domain-containing protein [Actinomycetota bacterium]|nr:MASE3 domain-containing protein [Actinomycetota bacterium]